MNHSINTEIMMDDEYFSLREAQGTPLIQGAESGRSGE